MAPMLVVASIAIAVCGMFGMHEATRSPGRMPRARNWVARTRTLFAELRPGQAGQRGGLRLVVQRILPGPLVAQHVLGVVQSGAGKPVGTGHGPGAENRGGRVEASIPQ